MGDFIFVKDYMEEQVYRKSLNELMELSLGYNLEAWYQMRQVDTYYMPYSFKDGDKIIANISVYKQHIISEGQEEEAICLEHIVAHPEYYHQNLLEQLINEITEAYSDYKIYLRGEDTVMPYYPSFGFESQEEVARYIKFKDGLSIGKIEKVSPMVFNENIGAYQTTTTKLNHHLEIINNVDRRCLDSFTKYQEDIYYIRQLDTYVIAKIQNDTLEIIDILSKAQPQLNQVIGAFHEWQFNNVKLICDLEATCYEVEEQIGDDLDFIKEKLFTYSNKEKYTFPLYIEQ